MLVITLKHFLHIKNYMNNPNDLHSGGICHPRWFFGRQKSIFQDNNKEFAPKFKLASWLKPWEENFSKNISKGGPTRGQNFQFFSKKNFLTKVAQNRLKRILVYSKSILKFLTPGSFLGSNFDLQKFFFENSKFCP